MALRIGDRITLSATPSIQIAEYVYVKPMASVSSEKSADETDEELVARMEAELQRLLHRSLLIELNMMNEAATALEGGTKGLADYAMGVINGNRSKEGRRGNETGKKAGGTKVASRRKVSARRKS